MEKKENILNDISLFRDIFESSVEGILVVSGEGVIGMANPAAASMFGYKTDEMIGRYAKIFIPKAFSNKNLAGTLAQGEGHKKKPGSQDTDLWGVRKDGSQFPLELRLSRSNSGPDKVVIAGIRDTTSLISSQFALTLSKRELEETQQLTHVGSWYRNLVTGDAVWSDEFYRICGLKPDDKGLKVETVLQLIHPEDRELVVQTLNRSIDKKETYFLEVRLQRPDGDLRYLVARGKLTFDKKGKPLQMVGTVQDITDFKESVMALEKEREKLSTYLDTAASIFVVINAKREIQMINQKGCEILGCSREEILGKDWFIEFIPEEERRKITALFNKVLKGRSGPDDYIENAVVTKGGERRLIRWRNTVLRDDQGKEVATLSSGVDITKTKAVEETLFVRNRALEAAGNGIIIADAEDPELPIIYSNEAFTKITGYRKDEVLGKNCRFLQNQDREQKEVDIIRKAIKDQRPVKAVLRNYRKDGTLFWNELTITPVKNNEGKLTHFIGVQNDVTERKRVELFKDQVRLILRQIAQNVSLSVIARAIVRAAEGHIPASLAAIMLLDSKGGKLKELAMPNLPKPMIEVLKGTEVKSQHCSCARAAVGRKEVFSADITKDPLWEPHRELVLQNGLRSCWSFPILSSGKKILGTFAVYTGGSAKELKVYKEIMSSLTQLSGLAIEQYYIRKELEKSSWLLESYAYELEQQVTTRTEELKATVQKLVEANLSLEDQVQETKAAEERALRSQVMFAAIARNFPKGVIVVFNEDHEIVYIEGGELRRMGLKKEQLEGLAVGEIEVISKERVRRIREDIEKTLAGEHLSFEINFRNRDYSVNTSPLQSGNEDIKWTLFVYNDISSQKQAEMDIRKALDQAQELNELKSRFISMASHEFRTPLSAIMSSAILIGRQNEPGKEEKREKYLERIKSNVRNLTVILDDFLSLSKLEEGKVVPKPESVDLVEFLRSLLEEVEPAKKRGQKIEMKSNQKSLFVNLDRKLMGHILINLISNAIKYSDESQEISLRLKGGKKQFTIEIEDRGIGIPDDEQDKLFQRFFRAENSTNIQGTGLGLHIVKQYTELMGGTVGFESREGEGTRFWVKFPVGEPASH